MLTIEEVAQATGGTLTGAPEPRATITGVAIDSRTVKPGQAFFALKGNRFDGHDFINQAFKNGAKVSVISSSPPQSGIRGPVLLVPDTVQALGDLASYWRRKLFCPVIAVTGTNGKTTTKNLIASVLARKFRVHKTEGNFNNLIGLPLMVLQLKPSHQVGVFELGMSARGEIARLSEICQPDIGVITNIGPAHLAGLGSIEEIARAKFELLEYLRPDSWAVLNYDNLATRKGARCTRAFVVTFGRAPRATIQAQSLRLGATRTEFKVDKTVFRLRLLGIHNAYNALAAIACGRLFGVSETLQKQALGQALPEKLRTQIFKKSGVVIINDTYNANPDSVRAALQTLSLLKKRRTIVVLGGMLELGDDSPRLHRSVAREVHRHVDQAVFIGREARAYYNGKKQSHYFEEKSEAIKFLKRIVRRGDVVLVKGSRATGMDEVAKQLVRN